VAAGEIFFFGKSPKKRAEQKQPATSKPKAQVKNFSGAARKAAAAEVPRQVPDSQTRRISWAKQLCSFDRPSRSRLRKKQPGAINFAIQAAFPFFPLTAGIQESLCPKVN
jgi:hypothetical protein